MESARLGAGLIPAWRNETFINHVMGGLTWALQGASTRAYGVGLVGYSTGSASDGQGSSASASASGGSASASRASASGTLSSASASASPATSSAGAGQAASLPLRVKTSLMGVAGAVGAGIVLVL